MTYAFFEDFLQRKRHVRHYLAVVGKSEREVGLGASAKDEGRLLTLRAGLFLVLYNLIEASVRNAVHAIHDKITLGEVGFPDLNVSLRQEVIRLFKRQANPEEHHSLHDFPSAFVAIALVEEVKMGGTVDAKTIREIAACYGFSHHTDRSITRDGADLLTVKRNRNDLAHGDKTFEEVGREYAAVELMLLSRRTMRYMDGILGNIIVYLDKEDYRDRTT